MSYDYLIVNVSRTVKNLQDFTPDERNSSKYTLEDLITKIESLYSDFSWEKVEEDIFFGSISNHCSVELWLSVANSIFTIKASGFLSEKEVITLGKNLCMSVFDMQTGERIYAEGSIPYYKSGRVGKRLHRLPTLNCHNRWASKKTLAHPT